MQVRFFLNQGGDWDCVDLSNPSNNCLVGWVRGANTLGGLNARLFEIIWGIKQPQAVKFLDSSEWIDYEIGAEGIRIWERLNEEVENEPGEELIVLSHTQALRLLTYWYEFAQGRFGESFELNLNDFLWAKFLETDTDGRKAFIKAQWIAAGRKWPER